MTFFLWGGAKTLDAVGMGANADESNQMSTTAAAQRTEVVIASPTDRPPLSAITPPPLVRSTKVLISNRKDQFVGNILHLNTELMLT